MPECMICHEVKDAADLDDYWACTACGHNAAVQALTATVAALRAEAERQRARAEAAEGERLGWRAAFYGVRQLAMDECTRAATYRRRALALSRSSREWRAAWRGRSWMCEQINDTLAAVCRDKAAAESRAAAAEQEARELAAALTALDAAVNGYFEGVNTRRERLAALDAELSGDEMRQITALVRCASGARKALAAALPQPAPTDAGTCPHDHHKNPIQGQRAGGNALWCICPCPWCATGCAHIPTGAADVTGGGAVP